MKIVKINGGLGNQMFQYSFYRNLKNIYKDVKIDISAYDNSIHHNGFEINRVFNIKPDIATITEASCYGDIKHDLLSKLRRKLFGINKESHIVQNNHEIIKFDFFNNNYIYLDGYWQNTYYFKGLEDEIKNDFTIKQELNNQNKEILSLINNSNSVSIHVRRGDYISNKNAYKRFGNICDEEYYNRAIRVIEEKISNPIYFIFSDDVQWVKEKFNFKHKVYFVNWNLGLQSFVDMYLISKCKYNIIANSTFSWWGTWLNDYSNKIVIAPTKWFNDDRIDLQGLILDGWIKV